MRLIHVAHPEDSTAHRLDVRCPCGVQRLRDLRRGDLSIVRHRAIPKPVRPYLGGLAGPLPHELPGWNDPDPAWSRTDDEHRAGLDRIVEADR